jgi:hypothetical protein
MSRKENDVVVGRQLYFAAEAGNVAELRRLIEGGADVNDSPFLVSVYMLACASCETQEYDGSRDTVTDCA